MQGKRWGEEVERTGSGAVSRGTGTVVGVCLVPEGGAYKRLSIF